MRTSERRSRPPKERPGPTGTATATGTDREDDQVPLPEPFERTTPNDLLRELGGTKLRAVIELLRPFTLLAPILGGLSAALVGFRLNGGTGLALQPEPGLPVVPYRVALVGADGLAIDVFVLVLGVLTLAMINGASNAINQVYDAHIDRINKPYRPIPSGRVSEGEARTVAMVLYFIVLWRAALFRGGFGSLVLMLVVVTYLYSAPPFRFKKRLWTNNLAIAYARGLVGFLAGYTILATETEITPLFPVVNNPTPWAMGIVMGVFLIGAITTKDYADVKGDRRFAIRTLPVVYGSARASWLSLPFFILPFVLIDLGIQFGYLIKETALLLPLMGWALYAWWLGHRSVQAHERAPNKGLENSAAWVHMYLVLMALQIGFAAVYWVYYVPPQ